MSSCVVTPRRGLLTVGVVVVVVVEESVVVGA